MTAAKGDKDLNLILGDIEKLRSRLKAVEDKNAEQDSRLDALEAAVAALEARVSSLEDRVDFIELEIDGATISAECNGDGTITVTLTWGA